MKEIIVDNFAGGGGASCGIEMAGFHVDAACNHDAAAVAMHIANHPHTRHYTKSLNAIDPLEVTQGAPVGLAWFSPACTSHSKARGGVPKCKQSRDLAWIVNHWARRVRPRVIILENVEEFRQWGPLLENGLACKERLGTIYEDWKKDLQRLGYRVEERELRASHYGVPTTRKRLFVIARCDKEPIVWPEPTHGPGLLPYRTAAECIDWSLPVRSIFGREKPLAEATLRRIARGVYRYVINAADPFIVPHSGGAVGPFFVPRYGEREGQEPRCQPVDTPIATVVPGANGAQLCAAFLAQHNGGVVGHDAREPVSTILGGGSHQQLVTSNLMVNTTGHSGGSADAPVPTITTGGHIAEVRAFLTAYYGTLQDSRLTDPMATATTKDRFGLVTVTIAGTEYVIVDIGMRMLTPRELFTAQGFPNSYRIDPEFRGKPLIKTLQVKCCGNSVCPPLAAALVQANVTLRDVEPVAPVYDDFPLFAEVA